VPVVVAAPATKPVPITNEATPVITSACRTRKIRCIVSP
jgi:hypothetical protein